MGIGPRTKMIIGALLVLLGLWWYVPQGIFDQVLAPYTVMENLQSLLTVLQAGVGVLAIIIGVFVVWIERDELKVRRALHEEEEYAHISETSQGPTITGTAESVQEDASNSSESVDADEEDSSKAVCEECGKEFDTEHVLKVHKSQMH